MAGIESAVPFATNLMPQYQSPQEMAQSAAQTNLLGAQSGLVGQQTQTAQLANQITQMKMPIIAKAMSDAQAAQQAQAAQDAPPPSPGLGGFDPSQEGAQMDQGVNTLRVNQARTQKEQQDFDVGIALAKTGDTSFLDAAQTGYKNRVTNETAQKQLIARQNYDDSYNLATTDENAWTLLNRKHADEAATIKAAMEKDPNYQKLSPAEQLAALDKHVRDYATMFNSKLFAAGVTGDTLEDRNGITVNSRTGNKPIGNQTQTISPSTAVQAGLERRAQEISGSTTAVNAVGAIQPLMKTATTAASLLRQTQQVETQEAALDAFRAKLTPEERAGQITVSKLPPALQAIVKGTGKQTVQLKDLIDAVNGQQAQLDATIQTNEGVSGSMGSDARAAMTGNSTSPLSLEDDNKTWQQKLANRKLYRGQASALAGQILDRSNNSITSIVAANNGNPTAPKLNPKDYQVERPTAPAQPKAPAMPTGTKLQTYATAHFGGDVAKAQAYLQSQGYK